MQDFLRFKRKLLFVCISYIRFTDIKTKVIRDT